MIVWWTVLITKSKFEWTCEIEEVTLFLILALTMIITELGSKRDFSKVFEDGLLYSLYLCSLLSEKKNSIEVIVGVYNRTLDF